ncbi:MAG: hypothetical protein A3E78_01705 [Alphaproteobacteria bacterium RIFCSPHIGHO2_12_FULL_63_12]|nr:MAG: hypothetical protein A3E78_01705 [Alphaproteobacteria bacterium RIFCSPHIGHO2_12_FULL_63_12]
MGKSRAKTRKFNQVLVLIGLAFVILAALPLDLTDLKRSLLALAGTIFIAIAYFLKPGPAGKIDPNE